MDIIYAVLVSLGKSRIIMPLNNCFGVIMTSTHGAQRQLKNYATNSHQGYHIHQSLDPLPFFVPMRCITTDDPVVSFVRCHASER